jgi:transmembrane sensor
MFEDQAEGERPIDPLLARSLKGEASPEEDEAVRNWRRASPEHEVEYRELSRLVELSARLPELVQVPAQPSVAELLGKRGAGTGVISLGRWLSRRGGAWLVAAAAAVVLLGTILHSRSPGARAAASPIGIREVVTSAGETATLELQDGTVIRLAPSGRLRVLGRGGRSRREVALEGRGFFAVAHDGTPFVIRTDAGDVTVLGTRLDVEARGRDLRLLVVEGRVALSTARRQTELTAGEMGQISNGETGPVVKVPDVGSFVEWTGKFLAFESTPLRDAAREIERVYGVLVEIQDEQLSQRVITAWFRDKSLTEVVDVVCLAVAARCTIEEGAVRVLPLVHGGGR